MPYAMGAIIAGLVILGWGWSRADSVVSIATAVLVLWPGCGLLHEDHAPPTTSGPRWRRSSP